MRLLMPCEVTVVIEAFLADIASEFKYALVILFVIFQRFFGFKWFPTEATVEFPSRMAVHVFFVFVWGNPLLTQIAN